MASKWFPSVCKQYRVLSWGSSHSMTHFLSRKRRCRGAQDALPPPHLPIRSGREAESPNSLKSSLNGGRLLSNGLFLIELQAPGWLTPSFAFHMADCLSQDL